MGYVKKDKDGYFRVVNQLGEYWPEKLGSYGEAVALANAFDVGIYENKSDLN